MNDNKIHVLLVDDDHKARKGTKTFLEEENFIVADFDNGADALAHLSENSDHFSSVVMDYTLGQKMSGAAFLKKLKNDFPQTSVVVFSGRNLGGTLETLTQGADAVMYRPLDYFDLAHTIRVLDEHSAIFLGIARDVAGLFDCDGALVWLLNKKNNRLEVVGWTGNIEKAYYRENQLDASDEHFQERFKSGEPVHLKDFDDLEKAPGFQFREQVIKQNWKEILSTPLIYKGRLLGLIDAVSCTPRQFEKKGAWDFTIKIMKTYARQAVESINVTLKAKQLQAIQDITKNLSITLKEKLTYESILLRAISLTGAEGGWIYSFDEKKEKLLLSASIGIEKTHLDETRQLGEGITGWVAEKGISKYIRNVAEYKQRNSSYNFKSTKGMEVLSEVAVPLKKEGRTNGVLTLKSRRVNYFSEDEIDFLINLASIGAVALDRAKYINYFNEISNLAQHAERFSDIAYSVVNAIRHLTGDNVRLWTMSKQPGEGNKWMRIEAINTDKEKAYVGKIRIPNNPKRSICAFALSEKRTVICKNIQKRDHSLPPFARLDTARKYNWHSFIASPIQGLNGEDIGALCVYSEKIDKFSENDGQIIETFANQLASTYQRIKQTIALEKLANISKKLNANVLNTQSLLKQIVQEAQDITNADSIVLFPYDPGKSEFIEKEITTFRTKMSVRMPRKGGLAENVRKHRAIIVENLGEEKLEIGIEPKRKPDIKIRRKILSKIESIDCFKKENIHAFIGISLQSTSKGSLNKKKIPSQEVGVIYINFKFPHHFSDEELQTYRIFSDQIANVIYRHRLYVTTERQKQELDAINQFALKITAKRDLKERLYELVKSATELLGGDGGKIYLPTPDGKELKLMAKTGLDSSFVKIGMQIPIGKGMAGEVFESGKAMIIPNYSKWNGAISKLKSFFTSVIEVPLLLEETPIGVISVFADQEGKFNTDDLIVLKRLARLGALQLYNAKLYSELKTMYQISQDIVSETIPENLAKTTLKGLKKVVNYDKATIQLIPDGNSPRVLFAYEGFEEKDINAKHLLKPVNKDLLTKEIYETQNPLILSQTENSVGWKKTETTRDVASWVGFPLVFNNKVLGLMTLDHKIPGFYNEDVIKEQLQRFATFAAIALQNADLIAKLKRQQNGSDHILNRFYALINNIDALIYVKDKEGRFLMANKALLDFFEVKSDKKIEGKTDKAFFEEKYYKKFRKTEEGVIQTKKHVSVFETATTKKGNTKILKTTKVPILNKKGEVLEFIGLGEDISSVYSEIDLIQHSGVRNIDNVLECSKKYSKAYIYANRIRCDLFIRELFQRDKLESSLVPTKRGIQKIDKIFSKGFKKLLKKTVKVIRPGCVINIKNYLNNRYGIEGINLKEIRFIILSIVYNAFDHSLQGELITIDIVIKDDSIEISNNFANIGHTQERTGLTLDVLEKYFRANTKNRRSIKIHGDKDNNVFTIALPVATILS